MINETILENVQVNALQGVGKSSKSNYKSRRDEKDPHIVAILPRGEAIRNFVYTGAMDELAREAKLTLLSVVPNKELQEELRLHCDELISLRQIPEHVAVENIREVLDMAHGRWLWSKAAQERWLVHDSLANGNGERWRRSVKKIACRAFASRIGLSMLSKLERASSRALSTTDEYVKLFKETKPSLVFNGSHVHGRIALQPVQAAQWLGIPTATFIFSWDNLTSQGRIIPQYDYYLVWNETLRDQLIGMYDSIRPEQVIVTGTPQFDFHFRKEVYWTREEFCSRIGADPSRPIILYSTGMANHMPGEPEIVEGIAKRLRSINGDAPPQLLVRVYPKDHTGRFDEVKRRNPDILVPEIPWEREWLTPRVEDTYLLTNMLRHAEAGINIASTVSLELCMFDKPVINVGYNPAGMDISPVDFARYYEFDHYRPVVESGAVRVAGSEDELIELLQNALDDPQADSQKRQALISSMFGARLDGYCGTRVANCLANIARSKNIAYA